MTLQTQHGLTCAANKIEKQKDTAQKSFNIQVCEITKSQEDKKIKGQTKEECKCRT